LHWIYDSRIYENIALNADKLMVSYPSEPAKKFSRLLFDSEELCTRPFFELLKTLMTCSSDTICHYLVIDPDPRNYFKRHFNKYPLVEIDILDTIENYLMMLNEDPGFSPADAIGTNWSEYLIIPPSKLWFIRAVRDDSSNHGGHLWIPKDWQSNILNIYPYAFAQEA
jgi:hypothetical protein